MDALWLWDEENDHWQLVRGSCGCCSTTYYTDPECVSSYSPLLTQDILDDWEQFLWEQLDRVARCREAIKKHARCE